jgi:hypothetical protein
MRHRWTARALVSAFAGLLLVPAQAEAALPANLQASLFAKILNYDKKLSDTPAAERGILIVSTEARKAAAVEMQDALRAFNLPALLEGPAAAAAKSTIVAVYVLDKDATKDLQTLGLGRPVLTMSGDVTLAERGLVSVALGVGKNGRPEIVVNLARLRTEGHEFAAELLWLARVIKD